MDDTEPCDWKVDYYSVYNGAQYRNTAYLDRITTDHTRAWGTHKHTDAPLELVMCDGAWHEVSPG